MSVSFQSKDDAVLALQLSVQELNVKLNDSVISVVSASDITIDVKETIGSVLSAIFIDNSAGTSAPVVAANRVVSGSTVKLTLSAPLAANDCVTIKYVINEQA